MSLPVDRTLGEAARSGEALHVVHSPEQVALHLPVAGPTSRMLAYAIDAIGILVLLVSLLLAGLALTPALDWMVDGLGPAVEEADGDPEAFLRDSAVLWVLAVVVLLQLAVELGWFTFWELASHGRSPGKMAIGLRVVRADGSAPGLRESLMRNLLRAVDFLPANYVVGLVAMVLSPSGQRLGDSAAGTRVVRLDRPPAAPPIHDAPEAGAPQFRFERAQMARLGRRERALLRQTLRRREELGPEAAAAAVARSAELLAQRLGHPPVAPAEQLAFLRALQRAAR